LQTIFGDAAFLGWQRFFGFSGEALAGVTTLSTVDLAETLAVLAGALGLEGLVSAFGGLALADLGWGSALVLAGTALTGALAAALAGLAALGAAVALAGDADLVAEVLTIGHLLSRRILFYFTRKTKKTPIFICRVSKEPQIHKPFDQASLIYYFFFKLL
jgi:hypothetical protein